MTRAFARRPLARGADGRPAGGAAPAARGVAQAARPAVAAAAPAPRTFMPPVPGEGTALGARERGYFEPRFGRDLGGVRVHTDAAASASAVALGAEAYTVGRDVYFRAGRYDPQSTRGRSLLAHELTHTMQQERGDVAPRVQRTITVERAGQTTAPHKQTNGDVVVGLFNELCADTKWELAPPPAAAKPAKPGGTPGKPDAGAAKPEEDKPDPAASRQLRPKNADYCKDTSKSKTQTSCDCVCQFMSSSGPHASIAIDQTRNNTVAGSQPNSWDIKLTGLASTDIKGVQGAAPAGASPLKDVPDPAWLILGHELCGHALTSSPRAAKPNAIPYYHQSTAGWDETGVDIENKIRREHSAAGGPDLGIRAGSFGSLEGTHYGAVVALPKTMTLMTLLDALSVPATSHPARCKEDFWYEKCGSKAALPGAPILDRVVKTDNKGDVFLFCATKSHAAGTLFSVEGVFWHLASGSETKTDIATLWGVSVAKLDKANKLFANGVDGLGATATIPGGTRVIVPYNLAAGSTRYFLIASPHDCSW